MIKGKDRARLRADGWNGRDPLSECDRKRVQQLIVGRLDIGAAGEMLRFSDGGRGLQIVGEGDDRQQNSGQQHDGDELHGDGRKKRPGALRARRPDPRCEQRDRNSHPCKIEQGFHSSAL